MPNQALSGAITEASQFGLFSGLGQSKIESLCTGGEVKIHKHRELLFELGAPATHFGIVLSGAYKLSRINNMGEDSVIHFSCPGDVVAALVMSQATPVYPVNSHAMGPSRILLIKREIYVSEWLTTPELIGRVQSLLSTRMARFQSLKVMQRAPLGSKIAALLLQLVDDGKDEVIVPLPLTRREVADSLGVTVESVIRVMSDWDKKGYISAGDQHIKILKPEALLHIVHETKS